MSHGALPGAAGRRVLTAAVVLGVALVPSGPAMAAGSDRARVDRASCTAADGTYTKASGTRTCVTVATTTTDGPLVSESKTFTQSIGSGRNLSRTYTGTSLRRTTVVTTTTRQQRGNSPVTEVVDRDVTSTVVPVSCRVREVYSWGSQHGLPGGSQVSEYDMGLVICDMHGLFVA